MATFYVFREFDQARPHEVLRVVAISANIRPDPMHGGVVEPVTTIQAWSKSEVTQLLPDVLCMGCGRLKEVCETAARAAIQRHSQEHGPEVARLVHQLGRDVTAGALDSSKRMTAPVFHARMMEIVRALPDLAHREALLAKMRGPQGSAELAAMAEAFGIEPTALDPTGKPMEPLPKLTEDDIDRLYRERFGDG